MSRTPKRETTSSTPRRRGRPPKNAPCACALVLLDTRAIRDTYLKLYQKRRKACEKVEAELRRYSDQDEAAYRDFLNQRFGEELTRRRELDIKLSLVHTRLDAIDFVAYTRRMSKPRLCYTLAQKVTPERDFWRVMQDEIDAYHEKQRKLDEEALRQEEEHARHRAQNKADASDFDKDNFEDEAERKLQEMFEKMFGRAFGGGSFHEDSGYQDEDDSPLHDNRERELKRLYRELCLRHHPDQSGTHDEKTQALWNAIQNAYHAGDLESLRNINTNLQLQSGNTTLPCHEIDALIASINRLIKTLRAQLRELKYLPHWGFSKWTEAQREKKAREIKKSFERTFVQMEADLAFFEKTLERTMTSYKPKPKTPKTKPKNT